MSVAAGFLVTAAPAAHSAGANIVLVGSDTIQNVDDVLFTGNSSVYNIHANPNSPVAVPADGINCHQAVTYAGPPVPVGDVLAPNGSGNGRNALIQGSAYNPTGSPTNTGCVSIARSSGGPRSQTASSNFDPSSFEYYAFAMDAVSWSSPSLNAPAVLTPAQILGIYNCTYTNWAQVGGGTGAIQRFEPQPGSGTRSFFESAFLGGLDPTTISTPSCPAVITTQLNGLPLEENTGKEINPLFYQQAIIPHSAGQWGFQANNAINPTIDFRNGDRLGNVVATRSATVTGRTVADGGLTLGSTTVTSPGNNFQAGDAGSGISGTGIPAGDIVQTFTDAGHIELGSSANTRTVSDGITNKSIPCINTTNGSKNITINTTSPCTGAVTFASGAEPAGDVGAKLSIGTGNGAGIPDGATITTVTDGTHAVISKAATATNDGTVNGVNAITLDLDGGAKAIQSASAHFVTSDVGKVITGGSIQSATATKAATTITGISGDGGTAYLSQAATAFNQSAQSWTIDDPAVIKTGTNVSLTIAGSVTSSGSPTLTTSNGAFTAFDVGATVTGAGIPSGTTITGVSGNTATMSNNATATATPSVSITDLSESAVFWDGPDQIWTMNSASSGDPRATILETNISNNSKTLAFPGVRYVYHVLDNINPNYTATVNLVGFVNAVSGTIPATSICAGIKTSTINSYGFQALDTSNPGSSNPNLAGSHCRFYPPSP